MERPCRCVQWTICSENWKPGEEVRARSRDLGVGA